MLKKKVILRKNKRGNIVKIVREHYLRDDISCGFPLCQLCSGYANSSNTFLSAQPASMVDNKPTFFICDSSIPLHQMDVLEHAAVKDFIILNSVLDEVKEKSIPLHSRLRSLTSQLSKQFYVFSNEYHKDTFVERLPGESLVTRNIRAVFKACQWYQNHLRSSGNQIVLVSNDESVRKNSSEKGIRSISMTEYAEALKNTIPELLDMVAHLDEVTDKFSKDLYSEYLPQSAILSGLKSGLFYQGKLDISSHNVFEGSIFANINGVERRVTISGKLHLNRAIYEDIVIIELLPRSQWKILEKNVEINEDGDQNTENMETNENVFMEDVHNGNEMEIDEAETPYARVVGIIRRNWRPYAGVIDAKSVPTDASASSMTSVWFYPVDRKIPKIRIRTRQLSKLANQKILVAIDSWSSKENFPSGHYVRTLGAIGDKTTEMEALLLEHDVPFQPFTQEIMNELPVEGESWVVNDEHLQGREDLRHLNICSIDPPGCTDIDDALHCRLLPNGNYEVGVHIADVSYFVKPYMKMDTEAAKRGTTVYLVDKRLDMLPSLLGTNLCSLRSNIDRLAFSAIWEMDKDAHVINSKYAKSIIRSQASFTYGEAQSRIDDPNKNDDLTVSIRTLNRLAKILREKRRQKGSIMLSSPEVRFKLEHDSQDPIDVELKDLKETNALVEEFMLLANIYVAKEIFLKFPEVAVLRRHPKPETTNFEALNKQLTYYGINLKVSTSKELADSLDKAEREGDKYFNNLVRILTTRCMMQAKYFCSGSFSYEDFCHYGLATEIYTHFTSPIRRYADILVHRLLHACIDTSQVIEMPSLFDRVKISEVCDNINFRHTMAQQASRSSVELYTNLFFRGKKIVESGYVIRILKNGFGVLIPKYGIEGFVYATSDETKEQLMTYDPDTFTLSTFDSKTTLRVFSNVTVLIIIEEGSISGLRQRLRMKLVDPKVGGISVEL